jgi:hypothetical protein
MRKIILLIAIFISSSISAQVGQARILKVNDGQMDNFVSSVSKKTKMFNDSEGSDKYFTFRILTGPNTNDFIRVRWMESIGDLDNYNPDSREQKYWQKNVTPYYTEGTARVWTRNNNLSYVPENPSGNLRRVIYYNYKDSGEQDFWRFRQRVRKAIEASGYGSAMNVLWCSSGCSGNWVQVRFHHDGYAGQSSDYGEPLQNMIQKYNEMYGGGSYEQDVESVNASLMPNGRRIVHMRLLREATSN